MLIDDHLPHADFAERHALRVHAPPERVYHAARRLDMSESLLVRTLVAQVHTDYAEDISLQAFATEHNVSLAYFSRLFKEEVGLTFSDYLTRVRIEKAKELLERQDLRLSDISGLVGYDDPKYFGQIFRKVAGISALDYQRSRQRDGQRIDSIAEEQGRGLTDAGSSGGWELRKHGT